MLLTQVLWQYETRDCTADRSVLPCVALKAGFRKVMLYKIMVALVIGCMRVNAYLGKVFGILSNMSMIDAARCAQYASAAMWLWLEVLVPFERIEGLRISNLKKEYR